MRKLLPLAILVVLGGLAPPHGSSAGPRQRAANPAVSRDQKFLHALNRLAFGPRPGDLERVKQMGLDRWIEQQLHPEQIDDSAAQAQLAPFEILRFTPEQLAIAFVSDQQAFIRAAQQAAAAKAQVQPGGAAPAAAPPRLNPRQAALYSRAERMALPRGTSVQAVGELVDAKLALAISSQRQLQEVLVDFWSNHFNLDVKKALVRTYIVEDERDVIRSHVFGTFRELLEASAKSPAMLFYLDNFRSTRAIPVAQRPGAAAPPRATAGLNENYARELMELHTLGVDGGYTQKDVQEVARCFTGLGD